MAASSNRSPSPMSSRPNLNPNTDAISTSYPRPKSEKRSGGDGSHRRSFSGGSPFKKPAVVPHANPWSFSPKTPASSSADFSRRTILGRENTVGLFRDDDYKENENSPNLKPSVRARSSSVPRTSKHFMCPTISAVSKVTPSPKKKILGERNESIRTSSSLSDGKFLFFNSSSMEFADAKNTEIMKVKMEMEEETVRTSVDEMSSLTTKDLVRELSEFSSQKDENKTPTVGSKKKVRFDDDLVILSPDLPLSVSEIPLNDENTNDNVKESFQSPSLIAPLDADPVSAPYDPITNYLSPRPQFLRYKPNSRTEVQPDDSCSSETVSGDSDSTGDDETQSDEISVGAAEAIDSLSPVAPKEIREEPVEEKVEPCVNSVQESSEEVKNEPCENSAQQHAEEAKVEPCENSAQQPAEKVKVEPCQHSFLPRQHVCDSAAVKLRVISKPRSFSVLKAISLVILLSLVGFLSVIWFNHRPDESGGFTLHPYQTLSGLYHDPHQFGETATQTFNEILQHARQSSVQFVNYVSVVLSPGEVVKYHNLTFVDEKYQNDLVSQGRVDFLKKLPLSQDGEDITSTEATGDSNTNLVMEFSTIPEFVDPAPSAEVAELMQPSSDHEDESSSRSEFEQSVSDEGFELNHFDVDEDTTSEIETSDVRVELVQVEVKQIQATDEAAAFVELEDSLVQVEVKQIQATDEAAAFVYPTEPANDVEDILVDAQTTFQVEKPQVEGEQMEETIEAAAAAAANLHSREPVDDIDEHTGDTISEEECGETKPDVDSNLDTGDLGVASSESSIFEASAEHLQLSLSQIHIGILLSVPFLAASVFILIKYLKTKNKTSSSSLKDAASEKSTAAEIKEEALLQPSFHENNPSTNKDMIEDVVDMVGDSCPSEDMSSYYQKSSFSYQRNNKGATTAEEQSEADSKERRTVNKPQQHQPSHRNNTRRDSLASSSSEFSIASDSYGSFTTYSIRPRRHGDEEVVTPVRRSSRIRTKP